MGIGMATRLMAAGHNIRIYNRTREKTKPLTNKGAEFCATPRQACDGADAIISMVGDDIASQAVWLGEDGALSATPASNAIAIECATLSHDWVMALSKTIAAKGLAYLDCPVTGLPAAAMKGELTLFLGGEPPLIQQAQTYLSAFSNRQVRFGGIGAGTAYKLIANLMGSIQIVAAAEGLLAAEKAGLDLALVARELGAGSAGSPQVARNARLMVEAQHDKDVLFNANWRLKDTRYGAAFSEKIGQHNALGDISAQVFQQLVDAGHARLAESKVIDTLRDAG